MKKKDKDKKNIGEAKQASQVGWEAAITNLGAWHTFSTFEKSKTGIFLKKER